MAYFSQTPYTTENNCTKYDLVMEALHRKRIHVGRYKPFMDARTWVSRRSHHGLAVIPLEKYILREAPDSRTSFRSCDALGHRDLTAQVSY